MELLAVVLIMVILAAVLYVVSAPLRRGHEALETRSAARRAELEAAKEAKYREIRDAEMDFQTGKMDAADHKVLDRQLRAEAMEILHALDKEGLEEGLQEPAPAPAVASQPAAPKKVSAGKTAPALAAEPAGAKEATMGRGAPAKPAKKPVTTATKPAASAAKPSASKPATPSTNQAPRKNRRRGR